MIEIKTAEERLHENHSETQFIKAIGEEVIELRQACEDLQKVIQMCFDDSCSMNGKISKKTALELIKHANLNA